MPSMISYEKSRKKNRLQVEGVRLIRDSGMACKIFEQGTSSHGSFFYSILNKCEYRVELKKSLKFDIPFVHQFMPCILTMADSENCTFDI